MNHMTFIENQPPAALAADSAASDFARSLDQTAARIAETLAPAVARVAEREVAARLRPSEKERRRAFEERLRTDRAFASEFRTAIVRHAATQGIPESAAAPIVLDAYLKEV